MSKAPTPRLDALRAMRERQYEDWLRQQKAQKPPRARPAKAKERDKIVAELKEAIQPAKRKRGRPKKSVTNKELS